MTTQKVQQDQAERERRQAAISAYYRKQSDELAQLIDWPGEPDLVVEGLALSDLADRIGGLQVSAANYDPLAEWVDGEPCGGADAYDAYHAVGTIIRWAIEQQNRLTGNAEDDE